MASPRLSDVVTLLSCPNPGQRSPEVWTAGLGPAPRDRKLWTPAQVPTAGDAHAQTPGSSRTVALCVRPRAARDSRCQGPGPGGGAAARGAPPRSAASPAAGCRAALCPPQRRPLAPPLAPRCAAPHLPWVEAGPGFTALWRLAGPPCLEERAPSRQLLHHGCSF